VVALDTRTQWLLRQHGVDAGLLPVIVPGASWKSVHQRIAGVLGPESEKLDLFRNLVAEQCAEAVLLGDAFARFLRQVQPRLVTAWVLPAVHATEAIRFLELVARYHDVPFRWMCDEAGKNR
jgi:hypothetical protein